jgi:DNA-binding SARP family transcriptional activator
MEMPVESDQAGGIAPFLELRLLGPMTVLRERAALALPASRKARALLAYMALATQPLTRSHLCELLWDVPNDPKGELRWCLSKIRKLVDAPGRPRVVTRADTVRLDLTDCAVDALEVARAIQEGVATLDPDRLRRLGGLFAGDFLDGLDIDRSPAFGGWLTAQRRRFRGCQVALLERLAGDGPDDDALASLEQWLALAPYDRRVHETLLAALARRGRIRDGDEHLASAARLFEAEGLDHAPLREAWRAARAQAEAAPKFREARAAAEDGPGPDLAGPVAARARRASIAVMPFIDRGAATVHGGAGDGLAHDVITRLAKLRSLFVIAQGTVFALHERQVGPEEAGRMLNVDYVVGGSVRRSGERLVVEVELAETRSARIVWAETFDHRPDDAFLVLDEIGNRIVASVASEIETIERNRAILRPPSSLDAWEAHHRGLWHMYRFSRPENERARHFFEMAVRLDPTFARAHAGLSFTHFQDAFQGWAERAPAIERSYAAAGQGLMADDRDPAAHWAMGRALWLRGLHDQSVGELEQAVELSPNFALAHYNLAFVHSTGGDRDAAISSSDHARSLSPCDPMLFGMLGARAMALVRLGRFDEAADWAVRAAARPNAFGHIGAIAAYSLALAGRLDEARAQLGAVHATLPDYGVEDFLAAMQFEAEGAALFREGAARIGGG